MMNQPVSSMATYGERTVIGFALFSPARARTRKLATAPNHPTDVVTCATSAAFLTCGCMMRIV